MICFKDKTFCPFWKECAFGIGCADALTPKVEEEAEKWWGSKDYSIAVYEEKPNCYKLTVE